MKRTLSFLLCAILTVAMAFAIVGCSPREKESSTSVDLLTHDEWKDVNRGKSDPSDDNAGKTVFTFSAELKSGKNKFNPLHVTNVSEYNDLEMNLANKDLKDMKKLAITLKGPANTNVIVKFESMVDMEAPYKEISFKLTEAEQTVEFDLSFEKYAPVRASLRKLVMFFGAGNASFVGDVYISKLEFNKEAPIAENVKNKENPDIKLPNIYDGTSASFDVNKNWRENDKNTFDCVTSGSKTTVTVKDGSTGSWKFVATGITGKMKALTKLTAVMKGKAGTRALLKIQDGGVTQIEKWVDFDGTEQTFIMELKAENLPDEAAARLLLFANPESAVVGEYTIEITKMEFSK